MTGVAMRLAEDRIGFDGQHTPADAAVQGAHGEKVWAGSADVDEHTGRLPRKEPLTDKAIDTTFALGPCPSHGQEAY